MFVGIGQSVVRDERGNVPEFGRIRFEKFSPRRNAVEKIGDADGRARGQAGGLHVDKFSTSKFEARAFGFRFVARFKQQARDGGNRGERFAAKAERRDGKQIVGGAEFACRVALEGQQRVVVRHAVAIVDDADHPLAADFGFNANRLGTGVERVFKQLFDDRRGAFDYFARSDFIRHRLRQYAYSRHLGLRATNLFD